MTTMTTKEMIDGYAFVRQVIGFAKMGVMIQPSVRSMALQTFEQLREQETITPDAVRSASRVLEHLRTGLLPVEGLCREAMQEIDEFLLPMRRDQRATDSMVEQQSSRERQRG